MAGPSALVGVSWTSIEYALDRTGSFPVIRGQCVMYWGADLIIVTKRARPCGMHYFVAIL